MAVIEVVKYNGSPDVFAWKYPGDELGTWTQLIVNESQEAILVKGGQVFDVFGPGRHTLDTANIPFLNKIVNLPFGDRSPFSAEVWFINRSYYLDVKWGTPSPIQIQDPKYGIFAPIRSNGAFGIHVTDSKKFLVKLVGTMPTFDSRLVTKYFRSLYVTKIKDAISSYLVKKKISLLEINAYIDELSDHMKARLQPILADYGLGLVTFGINEISVPEDDPGVQKLKKALSKRAEMDIVGYSYQQERSFDTLEGAAKNTGSTASPLMGAGIGLGMGLGMAPAVGTGFGALTKDLGAAQKALHPTKNCPKCHAPMPLTQRFCGACGFDTDAALKEEKAAADGTKAEEKTAPEGGAAPEVQPAPQPEVPTAETAAKAEAAPAVMPEPQPEEKPVRLTCASCGSPITAASKFCAECGRKLAHCPHCGADVADDAVSCPVCGWVKTQICPKCGTEMPGTAKFCSECGEKLVKTCPKCNTPVGGTQKFCPDCGEPL